MTRLEDRLVADGMLSRAAVDRAVEIARATRKPFPDVLVDEGLVSETDLLDVLARHHGLERVNLESVTVDPAAVQAVSAKLASHYRIMPVRLQGRTLTIAVSNPLDVSAAEDIQINLGLRVVRALARRSEIVEALRRHYGVGADTVERILAETPDREVAVTGEESHDLEKLAEDASVVRLVNQLLQESINDRATDIHFEVYREGVTVRRRIDGILYEVNVPRNIRLLFPAMVSRIKLMSGLNIVERRLPQDGRARVRIGRADYDLRISIVPAIHGEDIVIRILPATMIFDLAQLGFNEEQLGLLTHFIDQPHGIIFVTGPTGSGKSTTLYACLSRLNLPSRKIITIEDPVEYEMRGITQTQIHAKIGLTFATALRSMLRHDPDVMMVGEVRDRETAEVAVQTAMTGHLVLSTLHTNDAAGGAIRLIDMGIDPYLIVSSVQLFTAQRLVRVICADCREGYESEGQTRFRGRGCRRCNGSGYRGRSLIGEFLPLRPEIQDLILAKRSAREIRDQADALGMKKLVDDGWDKVARGITTADEVFRVTTL